MLAGGAIALAAVPKASIAFTSMMGVGVVTAMIHSGTVAGSLIAIMTVVYVTLLGFSAVSLARMMQERVMAELDSNEQRSVIQFLLRDFSANAEDWLWATDAAGRIDRLSERFAAVSGIADGEAIGRSFMDMIPSADPAILSPDEMASLDALRAAMSAGKSFDSCEVLVRVGAERRIWVLSAKAIVGADGAFAGFRGVGRDVTEARLHQQWLDATLANISQGIIMFDADLRVRIYNKAVIDILKLPEALLRSAPTFDEMVGYQRTQGLFDETMVFAENGASAIELSAAEPLFVRRTADGRVLEVRTARLPDGGFVRTFVDVTETIRQREALEAKEREYRSLFENAVMGIYRATLDGAILRANPALVHLHGCASEAEFVARAADAGADWYADPFRREEFNALMERDGRVTDFISEINRFKTGDRITISENAWLVRGPDGAPSYVEGTLTDITARREAEAGMERLAKYDTMTGLANRVLFRMELEQALEQMRRTNESFAVLLLDLDHFKAINDTRGHPVGDELLKMVAGRLVQQVREFDTVARLGGDEFAIILSAVENPREAANLADRIGEDLARPFRLDGGEAVIGVSIGITWAPQDGEDADTLIRHADLALYRVKGDGRGGYQFFEAEMDAAARRKHMLEGELRGALARGEMELFFQPVVDTTTLAVRSFEALMRWRHPKLGMLSPMEFIPLAEEVGLIQPLGAWALRKACETALLWPDTVSVAVNLSAAQFRTPGLFASVKRTLEETGLSPTRLELEITETLLIDSTIPVSETLTALRALGVRIALDDFGTGYSSLSYLRRFPFDKLKIDRSFVRELETAPDAGAIVDALIKLAGDLRMSLTVEGVETERQLEMLRRRGAKEIQGFLISRPVPSDELARFLTQPAADDPARVAG
jgi:diguanylate cyclase (GGDEF)-like protein/PAS domain S-box-containing protein